MELAPFLSEGGSTLLMRLFRSKPPADEAAVGLLGLNNEARELLAAEFWGCSKAARGSIAAEFWGCSKADRGLEAAEF